MTVQLITNNGSSDYTHAPSPGIVISEEYRAKANISALAERKVTWSIEGVLIPSNGDIDTQVLALKAAYELGELYSAIWYDSSEILEQLPDENGIRVEIIEFPEGTGSEWATKRRYKIVLSGSEFSTDVSDDGEYDYTIEYATEQNTLITRTISGTLTDLDGKTASTKYATLKAANGWETWTDANKISDNYSTDVNNAVCQFSIVHKKYFTAYGSGIVAGSATVETKTDSQDVERKTISGSFTGSAGDCTTAIDALRPGSSVLVNESINRDDYANTTSFTLEYISTADNDIIFSQEMLTIGEQVYGFVHKRVIGGAVPIKQSTSKNAATASQSGVIKKLASYPTVPAAYWAAANVKSKSYTRIGPEYTAGAGYLYGLQYSYEYEFDATPTF